MKWHCHTFSLAKVLIVACILTPIAAAHADTILTLDGNFAAPDYAFYTYTDTKGVVESNVPVAPYITNLNGGGYNNATFVTVCYDFNSDTPIGTALSGTVEQVSYFTGTAYTEIMESTYLDNELVDDGGLNAPLAIRGAISLAIWELMNPSSTTELTPFPTDPASEFYETQAANAVASGAWTTGDANLYPTWVPADPAYQRFGLIAVAPEPPTLVLTGLGLLGLALIVGKSRAVITKM